jgi:hypothetical protein
MFQTLGLRRKQLLSLLPHGMGVAQPAAEFSCGVAIIGSSFL